MHSIKRTSILLSIFLSCVIPLLYIGCSGAANNESAGGGASGVPYGSASLGNAGAYEIEYDNVRVEKMAVRGRASDQNCLFTGHYGEVVLTLNSEERHIISSLPVSLYIVKKDQYDEYIEQTDGDGVGDSETPVPAPEQYYVGLYQIKDVTPGVNDYTVQMNIPELPANGEYYVLGHVHERDVEDAMDDEEAAAALTNEANNSTVMACMDSSAFNSLDIVIDDVVLDDGSDVFVLFANNAKTNQLSNSIKARVDVSAYGNMITNDATLRFEITTVSGDKLCDLVAFNSATQQYAATLPVGTLDKYEKKNINVALKCTDDALGALLTYVTSQSMQEVFNLRIVARVSSALETYEPFTHNNTKTLGLSLVPDLSVLMIDPKIRYEWAWGQNFIFDNIGTFGTGLHLNSYFQIDPSGIDAKASCSVPVWVFRYLGNFMYAEARASYSFFDAGTYPSGFFDGFEMLEGYGPRYTTGMNFKFEFFGNSLYSFNTNGPFKWGMGDLGATAPADFINIPSISFDVDPEIDFDPGIPSNSFGTNLSPSALSYSKSYSIEQTVWIGPVPVTVEAGIYGEIGVNTFIFVGHNMRAGVIPYAKIGAYASAGVGVPGFSAGVEGKVDLITASMPVLGWFNPGFTVHQDAETKQIALLIDARFKEQIRLHLVGPNGVISLYAKYPTIEWCRKRICAWKCWTIKFPCGIDIKKATKPLVRFGPAFVVDKTLFSAEQSKTIILGKFPMPVLPEPDPELPPETGDGDDAEPPVEVPGDGEGSEG